MRTLVLTDLVGSTYLTERLGDRRAAELFERSERLARDLLRDHSGREVDKTDGFLLLFERPIDAAAFAVAYNDALAELSATVGEQLEVRTGIHLGEVIVRENSAEDVEQGAKPLEVEGLAKPIAARLMSLARGRQILLTRAAFDLARRATIGESEEGAELEWLAHGPYLFQGVEEVTEVFEVGRPPFAKLAAPPDSEKAKRVVLEEGGEEYVETLGWRPALGRRVPGRANWELKKQLGEGGYGEVWLGEHEKTHSKRVFKFCFDPRRVRGLQREVVLFRLLKESLGERDDIAQIVDWQFTRPPYYLESEYSEAGDLVSWLEAEPAPLETRLELVAQAATALAAAHSVGVLHKDIKPQNLLVRPGVDGGPPHASLTDFGIGLVTGKAALEGKGVTIAGFTKTLLSSSGSSGGTPLYLAPEILAGKMASTRSDVYALGVLLYQTTVDDFHRPLAPGWEREINDELLQEDIAACVDGDPERRLGDAAELAGRLRTLDERRAKVEAERRLRRVVARHLRRKRQFTVATIAGLTLTALVALAAFRESRLRRQAEEDRYLANVQLASVLLDQGQTAQARQLLQETAERSRQWEWGYLVNRAWPQKVVGEPKKILVSQTAAEIWDRASTRVVKTLEGHTVGSTLTFSADGKRLLSVSLDSTARVWELGSGRQLLEVRVGAGFSADLSSDGRLLVVCDGEDATRAAVWDVETGERLRTLTGGANWVDLMRFSPDNERIAGFSLDQTIFVWETSTGSKLLTVSGEPGPDGQAFNDFRFLPDGRLLVLSGQRHRVETWDPERGERTQVVDGPPLSAFLPKRISPDLAVVVSAETTNGTVLVWDVKTGVERFRTRALPGTQG